MDKANALGDSVCNPPQPRPDGPTKEELMDVLARHIIDESDTKEPGDSLFDYKKFFHDNNMTIRAKEKLEREVANPTPRSRGNKRSRRGGITDRG